MYRRLLAFFCRSLVSLVAVGYLLINPGAAPAIAAPLTQQQVSAFLAHPSALLAANPDGGPTLVSSIRDLMLTDPATTAKVCPASAKSNCILSAIIALLAEANANQQTAIGSGLGQAALALARSDPVLANEIQTALAASGAPLAIASYEAETGNVQIGAAGGEGGGGGSGPVSGGPPTGGGGGGGAGTGSSTGTGTSGGVLTGGGGVSGSPGGVASPVSPM